MEVEEDQVEAEVVTDQEEAGHEDDPPALADGQLALADGQLTLADGQPGSSGDSRRRLHNTGPLGQQPKSKSKAAPNAKSAPRPKAAPASDAAGYAPVRQRRVSMGSGPCR